jgi:hypothetical protein
MMHTIRHPSQIRLVLLYFRVQLVQIRVRQAQRQVQNCVQFSYILESN